MAQISFSPDWLRQFTDPYAVLGLSVAADDRRVLKRYRIVAKLLHPDSYMLADAATGALASQIFARLVSPSYQKIKQEKGRAEHMAMMRFRVRRMSQEDLNLPTSHAARQLINVPPQSVDIIYEQAIANLAELQYQRFDQFAVITEQLAELNLVYLRLKMGEPMIREKRTGIILREQVKPIEVPVEPVGEKTNYAQRHYERALEYVKKSHWSMAVQELRDAIRIDANKSDYHALLAKAYLMQNLPGMATVHFRQALKLNPKDELALEYAQKLKISLNNPKANQNGKGNAPRTGGIFGLFAKKR